MSDEREPKAAFKAIGPDEVTDLALLPRRFEQFAASVQLTLEGISNKLVPALAKFESVMNALGERVTRLERAQHRTDDHQARTDERLDRLEAIVLKQKAG